MAAQLGDELPASRLGIVGKVTVGEIVSLVGNGGGAPTVYRLPTNFPTTAQANTTRVDVTGWTFNVTAGKSYRIEINAGFSASATTTGGSMGVVLSSGSGVINGFMKAHVSQATVATSLEATIRAISVSNTLAGSFMTSTGVGVVTSAHNWYVLLDFQCITSGVFKVQWGTEVANSLCQLRSGSAMYVQEI